MHRQAPLLVLAVAAGILIGAITVSVSTGYAPWADDPVRPTTQSIAALRGDASGTPDPDQLADMVESLAQTLNNEVNERRVLSEQVEQLRSTVTDFEQNLRVRVEEAFQMESAAEQAAAGTVATEITLEERYAAAGISPQQLQSIRSIQADAQMAGIELDDRARREGWHNTPRYFQEAQALTGDTTAVRNVLGDDLYDRYLFTSGIPNRLMVGSIIDSSPAQKAGFRHGDVILRYGGERVFTSEQINELRSSGVPGEPVTVEILRDGRPLQLTIPRGPMGIGGAPTIVDPDAARD